MGGADNVQHHGQGRREEPGVVRSDLRTATELDKTGSAGSDRDEAKRDQCGEHGPIGRICLCQHFSFLGGRFFLPL